jgi:predicted dehydrogenase
MTVRVALVGYGSAGRGIHRPLLVAAGMTPSVVVTADPGRVAQVRAELPAAVVVPDLVSALGLAPDVAVLASPSGVHAEQVRACVAAGVPVVVDKPLAVDDIRAREVTELAAAAGVALTVFQNRRWDAENLTLGRLLQEGRLGEVHRFERRWERWRPVPKERWRERASAEQGGGILLDLHSHLVDSAVRFFGPVEQVYAEVASRTTPAEDEAFLAVRHAGGVVSHLTASSVVGAPGPRTRVLGSAGAYVVTTFESEIAAFAGLEDLSGCCGWLVRGEQREQVPAAPGGHADFYPAVARALAETDPWARQALMPVDPHDAVHVLEVIGAARRSAATATVVSLNR